MLRPPTANDRRCALADWLELCALFSSRRTSSRGDLTNVLDIADDESASRQSFDVATGEMLDQGILDEPRMALLDATFAELEHRADCLGKSYPFSIDADRMVVRTAFVEDELHAGQVAYTFCLLTTAIRDKMLSNLDVLEEEIQALPLHFQVCACLAAGGYFGGAVSSFGFPRAEGDAFLPALERAYKRFGYGSAKTMIEPGLPEATKDADIDVIAWVDHPDKLPGKLYSLGQTASGRNWTQKSVTTDVDPFHHNWFTEHPAFWYLPALYIPFLVYADLDEYPDDTYSAARARKVAVEERRFGLIFDRLRIAYHLNSCMADSSKALEVDGTTEVGAVARWVNAAVGKIHLKNAAL